MRKTSSYHQFQVVIRCLYPSVDIVDKTYKSKKLATKRLAFIVNNLIDTIEDFANVEVIEVFY